MKYIVRHSFLALLLNGLLLLLVLLLLYTAVTNSQTITALSGFVLLPFSMIGLKCLRPDIRQAGLARGDEASAPHFGTRRLLSIELEPKI